MFGETSKPKSTSLPMQWTQLLSRQLALNGASSLSFPSLNDSNLLINAQNTTVSSSTSALSLTSAGSLASSPFPSATSSSAFLPNISSSSTNNPVSEFLSSNTTQPKPIAPTSLKRKRDHKDLAKENHSSREKRRRNEVYKASNLSSFVRI